MKKTVKILMLIASSALVLGAFCGCFLLEQENITITIDNISLEAGESVALTPTIEGNDKNLPVEYSFSGENISIVDGTVTGIKPNTATAVTITCGKTTTRFTVMVKAESFGALSLSVPKNVETEKDNVIYTNYPARPIVAKFSNPDKEEQITYTVESEYADRVFIENGTIRAVGDFSVPTDVKITASTSHHYVTLTISVQELVGYGCGAYLYLEDRIEGFMNKWEQNGSQTGGVLYMGDSFFDNKYFFTNFYEKYAGENALCVGVGSTTTMHWELLVERLVYTVQPEVIAVHIGSNNVHDIGESADAVSRKVISLLNRIHEKLPDTKIVYFSMGVRLYASSKNEIAKNANATIESFCKENFSWITYVDVWPWFQKEDGSLDVTAYRPNDHAHPALHIYDKFIAEVEKVSNP